MAEAFWQPRITLRNSWVSGSTKRARILHAYASSPRTPICSFGRTMRRSLSHLSRNQNRSQYRQTRAGRIIVPCRVHVTGFITPHGVMALSGVPRGRGFMTGTANRCRKPRLSSCRQHKLLIYASGCRLSGFEFFPFPSLLSLLLVSLICAKRSHYATKCFIYFYFSFI